MMLTNDDGHTLNRLNTGVGHDGDNHSCNHSLSLTGIGIPCVRRGCHRGSPPATPSSPLACPVRPAWADPPGPSLPGTQPLAHSARSGPSWPGRQLPAPQPSCPDQPARSICTESVAREPSTTQPYTMHTAKHTTRPRHTGCGSRPLNGTVPNGPKRRAYNTGFDSSLIQQ